MKKGKESIYVKCPYYSHEESRCIHCEGTTKENRIYMTFLNPKLKKEYKDRYCKAAWGKCLLADMQNRKYGMLNYGSGGSNNVR